MFVVCPVGHGSGFPCPLGAAHFKYLVTLLRVGEKESLKSAIIYSALMYYTDRGM